MRTHPCATFNWRTSVNGAIRQAQHDLWIKHLSHSVVCRIDSRVSINLDGYDARGVLPNNTTVSTMASNPSMSSSNDPSSSSQLPSTSYSSSNRTFNQISSMLSTNRSTSVSSPSTRRTVTRKSPLATAKLPPFVIASYLVDQFNHYRHLDIVSRIKRCDLNLKLNDMCEIYSFDNHTYSLIRESRVDFQSLQHIYDAIVDRLIIQKLNRFCSAGQWCIGNLTHDNILFTIKVIRQHGHSFCVLNQCQKRLSIYANTCPALVTKVGNRRACSPSNFLVHSRTSVFRLSNCFQCSAHSTKSRRAGLPRIACVKLSISFIICMLLGHSSK